MKIFILLTKLTFFILYSIPLWAKVAPGCRGVFERPQYDLTPSHLLSSISSRVILVPQESVQFIPAGRFVNEDLFYSTEITLYLDRKTDGSMVQTEDVYLVLESVASQIYDAGLKSDFEGYITSDYLNRFYKKNRSLFIGSDGLSFSFATIRKVSIDRLQWYLKDRAKPPLFARAWDETILKHIYKQLDQIDSEFIQRELSSRDLSVAIDEFGDVTVTDIENIELHRNTQISVTHKIRALLSKLENSVTIREN